MKSLFLWLFIAIGPCFALAQTKISRSYPVVKDQTIDFHFDYPKIIHISTWSGNEVVVEANVNINNGESNRAFTLVETITAGKISISNKIDMDMIPNNYYSADKSSKDIKIEIHIKVPVNISTKITSVYGLVEVRNFNGPIQVDATYGGVDASVAEKYIGRLQLTTRYGKIYTNLNLKPIESIERNFFTSIIAVPGTGPGYNFTSSYGNIYLRSTSN